MTMLPSIPRLYTALAEVLAVLLYARRLPRRFHRQTAVTVVWALVLGIFLHKTGYVPLAWWVPCMLCAVLLLYGYLWGSRAVNWLEALYITARAFLLAEFAASAEWQLHCWLFPHRSGFDPLALALLAAVYGVVYGLMFWLERSRPLPEKRLIKVAVYSQGGFAMLRFEHYTETVPALDADGLPKQGSDLKSVRTTVGQHGGSMTLHWENNWCTLRILFPLSKNK